MSGGGRWLYVGYLALPRRHRVFLLIALPLSVIGMCVGAAGIALGGPAVGGGVWETGAAREFRGTLSLSPYPMLHVAGDGDGEIRTHLLVEMGKFGAADRFAGMGSLDGASVSVRGRALRRDGREMIEIDPDGGGRGESVSVLGSETPAVRASERVSADDVVLHGEIVDSKCFLGAMRPGAGRGHKACAVLCVTGGVPPVLVVRDGAGGAAYWLLTDRSGAGLSGSGLDAIKPMIGERVGLRGRPGRVGSWSTLAIDPGVFED